jgi:hypothetical protein
MQKNSLPPPVINNYNPLNEEALNKFNNCIHRSLDEIVSKSCCSTQQTYAFKCELKNIYPLSMDMHCLSCDQFKAN